MSSLVLTETRIPQGNHRPDALVTAEWFKAYEGARQYRVTWREDALWSQSGARYYDTAEQAVRAAQRCALRLYRAAWKDAE